MAVFRGNKSYFVIKADRGTIGEECSGVCALIWSPSLRHTPRHAHTHTYTHMHTEVCVIRDWKKAIPWSKSCCHWELSLFYCIIIYKEDISDLMINHWVCTRVCCCCHVKISLFRGSLGFNITWRITWPFGLHIPLKTLDKIMGFSAAAVSCGSLLYNWIKLWLRWCNRLLVLNINVTKTKNHYHELLCNVIKHAHHQASLENGKLTFSCWKDDQNIVH